MFFRIMRYFFIFSNESSRLKFSPISKDVEITVKWYIHIYSEAVIVYVPNVETKWFIV